MGLTSGESQGKVAVRASRLVRVGVRLLALLLCLLLAGCMNFEDLFDEAKEAIEESEDEWSEETGWDNPPYIVSLQPILSAFVTSAPTVSARFSETMDSDTIDAQTFTLVDSLNRRILGEVTYNDRTALFTPASLLGSDTYTATLDGAEDLTGDALGYFSWSFTVDGEPPAILSHDPATDAITVDLLPAITVEFSEELDSSTLVPSSFLLTDLAGQAESGEISYHGRTVSFAPANSLRPETTYRVTVTTAIQDLAGNPLPEPLSWTFTTVAASE